MNSNHTSSSAEPPQVFPSGEGVAPTKLPDADSVHDESELGVITVA